MTREQQRQLRELKTALPKILKEEILFSDKSEHLRTVSIRINIVIAGYRISDIGISTIILLECFLIITTM